jgi:putative Mn2+ efflux pump MntP
MSVLAILLISVGLAMDCFAVSIGLGTKSLGRSGKNELEGPEPRERFALGLKLGILFVFFQAGMALLGWLLGAGFRDLVSDYDHWIAFVILSIVGAKMIFESRHPKDQATCELNYI